MDRRVQRTRETLHHALISLMIEKGFDAITIQDLLDRANVGRSTFYAHYTGKEDLLRAGLRELRRQLEKAQRADVSRELRFAFSRALFEHAGSHRDVYHAIVGRRSGTVVMGEMRGLLAELVKNDLKLRNPRSSARDLPRAAVVQFVVGALMSLLTWWLEEKTARSAGEVDAIFRRLTLPALGEAELRAPTSTE